MQERAPMRAQRDDETLHRTRALAARDRHLFPLKDRNPTRSDSESARFGSPPGVQVTRMFPTTRPTRAGLRFGLPALVAQWIEHAPPKRGMQVRLLPGVSRRGTGGRARG